MAFSPDGQTVADRQPGRHGPALGRRHGQAARAAPAGTRTRVRAVAFSPDGKTVLTRQPGQDRPAVGRGHGPAARAALRHRGRGRRGGLQPRRQRRALTGSDDGTARLWDAATGQPAGPPLAAPGTRSGRGLQPRRPDGADRQRGPARRGCGRRPRADRSAPPLEHRGRSPRGLQPRRPDRSSPAAWTGPRGSGTRPPGRRSGCPCGIGTAVRPWPSAPTARAALTGSEDRDGAAVGRGHGPGAGPAGRPPARPGCGSGRRLQPRRPDRRSRAATDRSGAAVGRGHRPAARPPLRHQAGRSGPWPSAPTARRS